MAGFYRPISSQDAINRRIKRVLGRFTVGSILLELGPALGSAYLGVRPLEIIRTSSIMIIPITIIRLHMTVNAKAFIQSLTSV